MISSNGSFSCKDTIDSTPQRRTSIEPWTWPSRQRGIKLTHHALEPCVTTTSPLYIVVVMNSKNNSMGKMYLTIHDDMKLIWVPELPKSAVIDHIDVITGKSPKNYIYTAHFVTI